MLWPFSLFSKSPASEEPRFEKTAPYIKSLMPTVTIDQLLIPGFVDKSVSDWLDGLKKVHFDDKHLENLERCFVTRIDHVALAGEEARRDWKAVHEAIALQFHYRTPTLASHGTPRQDDTRALMIHRVPKGVDGSKQQKIQGSKLLSSSKVAAHDEVLVRLNYDNLKTSDKPPPDFYPTPRSTKYFSMRRLEPRKSDVPLPEIGHITALDCAILSVVIHESSAKYAYLNHMCMWFAATFFLAIERIAKNQAAGFKREPETPDRHSRMLGRFHGFQFVNPETARTLANDGSANLDEKCDKIRRSMTKAGIKEDEIKDYIQRLHDPDEPWARDLNADPIDTIVKMFAIKKEHVIADIRKGLDELEAKKNAYRREVDEERQEADRKLAEERQEADRKLAEERQEIERKLREERQEIERKLAEERQARQEERQESQREVAELREQVQRLAQAMSQLQPSSTTTPSGGSL